MADIHKITKNGETILPATTTDAIVHPQMETSLTNMINEYNVSKLFPTGGIDGGDTYTLKGAIALLNSKLTASQKTVGIKLAFKDNGTNLTDTYTFQGGTFTNLNSWGGNIVQELGDNEDKIISQKAVTELANGINEKLNLVDTRYEIGYANSLSNVTPNTKYKHCIVDIRQGIKIHNGIHNSGLGMVYVLNEDNNTLQTINVGNSSTIDVENYEIKNNIFVNSIYGVKGVKYLINLAADGYIEYTDVDIQNTFNFGGDNLLAQCVNAKSFLKNDIIQFSIAGSIGSYSLSVHGVKLGDSPKMLSVLYGDGEDTFTLDSNYDYFIIVFHSSTGNISEFTCELQKKSWYELKLNPANYIYNYIDGYSTGTNIAGKNNYKHIILRPQIGIKIVNGVHNSGLPMIIMLDKHNNRLSAYNVGDSGTITTDNYTITENDYYNKILANNTYYILINLASNGYIDFSNIKTNDVFLTIGSKFPIVEGNRLEIFKSSISNDILLEDKVDWGMKVVSGTSAGRYKSNAYYVNANNLSGELKLKCGIYGTDRLLIDEKEITIIPITKKSSPSTQKNILCIGASYTYINIWVQEFKRRLTESGGNPIGDGLININFIGTVQTTVPCEGYSGKSYDFFISSESPFYKNGKIDIAQYALDNEYNNIDYVLICLGADGLSNDSTI